MSSVSVSQVFTDLFNGLLAIIDQIALAVQSNAGIIATVVIIGAVAGAIYVFGLQFSFEILWVVRIPKRCHMIMSFNSPLRSSYAVTQGSAYSVSVTPSILL